MSDVVYLHVGAPKTGTTYVQDRLSLNRDTLGRHGYSYPIGMREDMFLAALDLLDRPWGGMRPDAKGEWDALVRRARRARGTAILSHEILAAATSDQARRALADLAPAEVHVVYSARDVARQVAAEWQEQLKHRHKLTFKAFVRQVQGGGTSKASRWFWEVQALPDVLTRWGSGLSPDRVHLVTVPQPGGPEGELWRRLCTAVALDPSWAPVEGGRRNPSLGAAESTLIRRLNARLREAGLPSKDYRALVRQVIAHETLAARPGTVPVRLPPAAHGWAEELAQQWIDWVSSAGVDVVGDLEDLRPARPDPDEAWQNPDKPRQRDVTDAALDALVALTLEAARRPDPGDHVPEKVARLVRRVRQR
jgi:hypothetical protein